MSLRFPLSWRACLITGGGRLLILLSLATGQFAFANDADSPVAAEPARTALAVPARHASFGSEKVSHETREIADWAVDSADNHGMPFIIVDKVAARSYVFDRDGKLQAATTVLLGLAHGDDAVPGIGNRKLASIRPEERTTPAGRFVASLGRNSHNDEILWIDYDAAISLHRIVKGTPAERRATRMASADTADKRISYGCINVPARFYDQFIIPAFRKSSGIVYVLPETRSARAMFGAYDVDEHARIVAAALR